jgi:hypothetical protein
VLFALVVPELSTTEPLAAVEVEAAIGLVEVGSVFDLGAVRQLLGDQASAPLDEQGQGYAVHGVTAALKERNKMIKADSERLNH